ncbi:MAG TPA: translation initiation factor IF-3, partial [Humisphaera sp.]
MAISTNFRHNHQIRISPVFLIDQADNKIGPTSLSEALRKAQESQLDLVEVAPNARPPVCKIMDYGKWRYQQQKKEHKSSTHKGGRLKMLNVDTVRIGEHDLEIKINKARDFLKEGNKVQFTLRFKGRELAHINLGRDLFDRVKTELWSVAKVERDAKMEGKRMTLVLQPDHKPAGAKPPVKGQPGPTPPPPPIIGGPRSGSGAGSSLNIPGRTGPVGPGVRGPGGPVGPGGVPLNPGGPVGPG